MGLTLPYDSDPGFYRDHYDREVKARHGLGEHDNFYVSERISGAEPGRKSAIGGSDEKRALRANELNVRSGFSTVMTTQADESAEASA